MLDKRMIAMGGATAACALAIGFFMQPETPQQAAAGVSGNSTPDGPVLPQEPEAAQLDIQKITLTAAPRRKADAAPAPAAVQPDPAPVCDLAATATALPEAMVSLAVSAPCQPGGRVSVHHQGMIFTGLLDAAGAYEIQVPALAENAVFLVQPASGKTAVASARVADLENYSRVVLQWQGGSGFELHALERGAAYGGQGHVWHGANLGAGTLVRLGDSVGLAPRMADIYSLPADARGSGEVVLSVEAEVTPANCGREITAEALEFKGGRLHSRDLDLQVPDCSAQGDFLVLNNLLENLKIAAN